MWAKVWYFDKPLIFLPPTIGGLITTRPGVNSVNATATISNRLRRTALVPSADTTS